MISFVIGFVAGLVLYWVAGKYWTKVNSVSDLKEIKDKLDK